jgi:hypothetical protein
MALGMALGTALGTALGGTAALGTESGTALGGTASLGGAASLGKTFLFGLNLGSGWLYIYIILSKKYFNFLFNYY